MTKLFSKKAIKQQLKLLKETFTIGKQYQVLGRSVTCVALSRTRYTLLFQYQVPVFVGLYQDDEGCIKHLILDADVATEMVEEYD